MAILDEKAFKKEILKIVNANMEGICEEIKKQNDDLISRIYILEERIKCLEKTDDVVSPFKGLELADIPRVDVENPEDWKMCDKCEEEFHISDMDLVNGSWICRRCER